MEPVTQHKVFGIGFQKTGTKSLAAAFETLGYRVTGPNGFRLPDIAERYQRICRRYSRAYDAFQDNPWPLTYKEMSVMWPQAKFILTLRDPDAWITSVKAHFGAHATPMRQLVYGRGSPVGHENHYVQRMQQHEADVRTFFADQPDRLLEMRITEGDGYQALCPFLKKPVPDAGFPWANKASDRQRGGVSGPIAPTPRSSPETH